MPSFFVKTTAAALWKGATGVSNASIKRGRGKGRMQVKDYNRGQEIGVGRRKLSLPGLNTPISKYQDVEDLGDNSEFAANLERVRKEMNTYKKFRDAPLDRGWSGRTAHGRDAGPPDSVNETPFEGFHSTVLMLRPLLNMTTLGRTKRMHALVVTGNGNGVAGFSTAVGKESRSVIRHARNMASQVLVSVPRWENHTVLHNFFSRYYTTTVFVERKPAGYGVKAHRVIQAICKAFGITDLYAKVEGSTNNQINLTKAFFLGLMNQKTYQEMADEKLLHLVELREETYNFPQLLASPKTRIRTEDELKHSTENLDFTYYINDGKIKTIRQPPRNPFLVHPFYYKHLDRVDLTKNREQVKLLMAAKYGDKKVLDVFPHFRTNSKSFYKTEES